jgi:hypothetical protein
VHKHTCRLTSKHKKTFKIARKDNQAGKSKQLTRTQRKVKEMVLELQNRGVAVPGKAKAQLQATLLPLMLEEEKPPLPPKPCILSQAADGDAGQKGNDVTSLFAFPNFEKQQPGDESKPVSCLRQDFIYISHCHIC